MKYANLRSKVIVNSLPGQIIDGDGSPIVGLTFENYWAEKGWKHITVIDAPADGYRALKYEPVDFDPVEEFNCKLMVVDQVSLADEEARKIEEDTARRNTPMVFDQPIETIALVLTSHDSGIGVGQAAMDDGTIVTFTYHASPIPSPAVIKQRILDAKAAHDALKSEVVEKGKTAKANINAAQNVPALRQAILDLQAQIDAINARIK